MATIEELIRMYLTNPPSTSRPDIEEQFSGPGPGGIAPLTSASPPLLEYRHGRYVPANRGPGGPRAEARAMREPIRREALAPLEANAAQAQQRAAMTEALLRRLGWNVTPEGVIGPGAPQGPAPTITARAGPVQGPSPIDLSRPAPVVGASFAPPVPVPTPPRAPPPVFAPPVQRLPAPPLPAPRMTPMPYESAPPVPAPSPSAPITPEPPPFPFMPGNFNPNAPTLPFAPRGAAPTPPAAASAPAPNAPPPEGGPFVPAGPALRAAPAPVVAPPPQPGPAAAPFSADILGLPANLQFGPATNPPAPNLRAAPKPAPIDAKVPASALQKPQPNTELGTEIPPHLRDALLEEAARITLAKRSKTAGVQ